MDAGGASLTNSNQTPNTVEYEPGRQTAGAKVRSREGNSPDHQLRSLNLV